MTPLSAPKMYAKEVVWPHKNNLTPPLIIEVSVSSFILIILVNLLFEMIINEMWSIKMRERHK
jgi:hypothetical protein